MAHQPLIKKIYKKRPAWSHKGDFGSLLVVGGSKDYSGSPAFNVLAAYRAGCDLVRLMSPEPAAAVCKKFSPDVIAFPLKGDYLSGKHVKQILDIQKKSDALIIGCGLTRNKGTMRVARSILSRTRIPTVIDADTIYVANKVRLPKECIITPHAAEFLSLTGEKVSSNIEDRKGKAKAAAKDLGCVVLLKGHVDVISDGRRTEINRTGNPYMTKGGTGDILAGVCGALLARSVSAFEAACAAAYITGRAGDMAARKLGEGTLASDIVEFIPKVIQSRK